MEETREAQHVVSPADQASSRRAFIASAAKFGITLPTLGVALDACARGEAPTRNNGRGGEHDGRRRKQEGEHQEHEEHPAAAPVATPDKPYARFDPMLPPLGAERTKRIHMTARELKLPLTQDLVLPMWTFDGTVPGPIVHVRQGDLVEFTLTNEGTLPHSMDFHAALVDPATAFKSIAPGQSISYSFRPKYAGAFLYHCGTQPILMHMGMGMYGAIIVSPATPLPPAKEFVLVQSEFYVGKDSNGAPMLDYNMMRSTLPTHVAFNGHPMQYVSEPMKVKKGDRVRFHVVNAGPTIHSAFHVVGGQFDTVYLGSPPTNTMHGVQTFDVAPGGGMVFEYHASIPGTFPVVNHAFGHGEKGAIGALVVEA